MARVQFFGLPTPIREPIDFTGPRAFVDPRFPDKPVDIILRPLSTPEAYACVEHADDLIKMYVTGDEEAGTPPIRFPIEGESPPMSRKLWVDLASIARMQVPIPGQDPYSAEELLACAINMEPVFEQIQEAIQKLNRAERAKAGNASGAATEIASQSPSDSSSTPSSPAAETPCSSA